MTKARDIADLGAVTSRLDTVGASDGALSNRNLIINGSHIVNQRDNLPTSGTSGGYPATDRWKYYSSTTSCDLSLSSVTMPDGTSANALKAASTTSGTHSFDWYQKVEPINYAHLDGQTVTMSCWVRSNSSNARLMLWHSGTGSIGQTPYTGSGDWQYLTVSGVIDASAATLEAYAAIGTETNLSGVSVTSGEYIEFTRCQLEVGDTATPFEHRSYGDELARCQRYYYDPNAQNSSTLNGNMFLIEAFGSGAVGSFCFPVTMRAAPSVSIFGERENEAGKIRNTRTGAFVGGSAAATNIGTDGFGFVTGLSGSLSTDEVYDCTYKADAEL